MIGLLPTISKKAFSLEEKVSFLKRPESYLPYTGKITWKETHMSWIFFAGEFVFKLKKPVKYRYLDHRTLKSRFRDCRREITLNKMLAEDIYLGLVPLTVNEYGNLQLSGNGSIEEWLVKMRRIPEEAMLDVSIKYDKVDISKLKAAATLLTRFYLASRPFNMAYDAYRKKLEKEIITSYRQLKEEIFRLPARLLEKLTNKLLNFLEKETALFQARISSGRIIEAHGDLRPEHVCLLAKPVIIDRLEFSHKLRILDTAEELSYFSMECEILGDPVPGKIFINTYSNISSDRLNEQLVQFYKIKRACLRAYLAARHIMDPGCENEEKWLLQANKYLFLAKEYSEYLY